VETGGAGGTEVHVTPSRADAAIVALARRRHGVVTTADLLQAGFGKNAIAAKVERGWLRRIHRGVYVVGAPESPLTKPAAALHAAGPNAVLSHRTAATLWEILPPRPADPIDLTLFNANRRARRGLRIHHANQLDIRRRFGLRLTSPPQTLLDLAASAPGELEAALNEAHVRRLVTHQEVRRMVELSRPGVRALREVAAENPGLTRSKAERLVRALVKRAGLPAPQSNVRVAGYEVDLYWPAQRLVVEYDGWDTHSSRPAFESDRLKDAALQLAGERVLRVTGRQLERRPEELVARFATGLAAAR
jgi:very-short-patch-repair endonuclease